MLLQPPLQRAVSRFHIGLVIVTGLGIGTLFTLFVVPAFYLLLSPERHAATRDALPKGNAVISG